MSAPSDSPRALIRYTLVGLVLTVGICWALWEVSDALVLVYISALMAIGLSPLVNAIERKRLMRQQVPRWAAILVIYLSIIGAIIGVGILVIPAIVTQARDLATELPRLLHQGQQWLINHGLLTREISAQEAVKQTATSSGAQDTIGLIATAVWGFVGGVFGVITMLVLAFYLMVDSGGLVTVFVRLFPRDKRAQVESACRRVTNKVSAWLGGQLLLAGIIGSTAALGLFLMLENHLLVPKIMQRQVGISPVFVIIALLIGGSLLGVIGAILAVPTAAILQVVFQEIVTDTAAE